jgi:hypothetical protein
VLEVVSESQTPAPCRPHQTSAYWHAQQHTLHVQRPTSCKRAWLEAGRGALTEAEASGALQGVVDACEGQHHKGLAEADHQVQQAGCHPERCDAASADPPAMGKRDRVERLVQAELRLKQGDDAREYSTWGITARTA